MRLWRNQAFAVFWSARTISFTGTGITIVVMPVLVYELTHSPAWVASLSLIRAPRVKATHVNSGNNVSRCS